MHIFQVVNMRDLTVALCIRTSFGDIYSPLIWLSMQSDFWWRSGSQLQYTRIFRCDRIQPGL